MHSHARTSKLHGSSIIGRNVTDAVICRMIAAISDCTSLTDFSGCFSAAAPPPRRVLLVRVGRLDLEHPSLLGVAATPACRCAAHELLHVAAQQPILQLAHHVGEVRHQRLVGDLHNRHLRSRARLNAATGRMPRWYRIELTAYSKNSATMADEPRSVMACPPPSPSA